MAHSVLSIRAITYDIEWLLHVISVILNFSDQRLEIRYISCPLNYLKMIRHYVCPIPYDVLLHLKYFKIVQGHIATSAPAEARSVSDS